MLSGSRDVGSIPTLPHVRKIAQLVRARNEHYELVQENQGRPRSANVEAYIEGFFGHVFYMHVERQFDSAPPHHLYRFRPPVKV